MRPCALPVNSVIINDRMVPPEDPLYAMFNAVLDVAAVEYLEGRAIHLGGAKYTPATLGLEIDLGKPIKADWRIWVEDVAEGPFAPEVTWRIDDDGDRGTVYNALEHHIRPLIRKLEKDPRLSIDSHMHLRINFRAASAHTKLKMVETRARLVKAFENQKA